ncbi:hypothetical protein [Streptomyces sp. TR02-1]|uniref:hypothetical protein n=1 Tax=Streptomyces sp. TR02-1 TaxID=3385977 RepID=UPI0039A11306
MPKQHARKKQLAAIKAECGVKHHEAAKILDELDAEEMNEVCEALREYEDITTLDEALAFVRDPRRQVMCDVCGWTWGMVCPECPGCGCYSGECTGWRHHEYAEEDPDFEPEDECECGFVGDLENPAHVYNCVC